MNEPTNDYVGAARELIDQHESGLPFCNLATRWSPSSKSDAYAIQRELFLLREGYLGQLAGYKVALTSKVMQDLLRFPSPFSGPLHSGLIQESGVTLRCDDYGRLCLECEIAATLASDIPKRESPYTPEDIQQFVDQLAPAIEIVDDRRANYDHIKDQVLTLIADNAWNRGLVHGSFTSDWHQHDLAAIHGTVSINGAVRGSGQGADVLGHPFNALAWLVNNILDQGGQIHSGMIVMTGTMIKTQFVSQGDHVVFDIPGLGAVHVHVA